MIGNCFDQTELERDWFTKNNYYVETYFEMVNLDYKNAYPTHSFLIYKTMVTGIYLNMLIMKIKVYMNLLVKKSY